MLMRVQVRKMNPVKALSWDRLFLILTKIP